MITTSTGWRAIGEPHRVGKKYRILARCGCGAEREVLCSATGGVRGSCRKCMGARMVTHGQSIKGRVSSLYRTWQMMLDRCFNEKSKAYPNYGGRGITVCDRWRHSFEAFAADVGSRPGKLELDRIENDGNYEPGNVRWATRVENQNNKRTNRLLTFNGETLTMSEWSRRLGCTMHAILLRLDRGGMTVEQALGTPFGDRNETRRQNGRWLAGKVQFIEHNGERLTCHQWAARTGIGASTIRARIQAGWSVEEALTRAADSRPRAHRDATTAH